ncbi:hypothetical protein BV392_11510 [Rhodovulum sulfidophilum]|nr:hypothetical protein BV392_11510 [Rhodovulum sulfidophilum]
MPEDLQDWIDDGQPLLVRGQHRRHPVDRHIGTTARDYLVRGEVGSAGLDRDLEISLTVAPLSTAT